MELVHFPLVSTWVRKVQIVVRISNLDNKLFNYCTLPSKIIKLLFFLQISILEPNVSKKSKDESKNIFVREVIIEWKKVKNPKSQEYWSVTKIKASIRIEAENINLGLMICNSEYQKSWGLLVDTFWPLNSFKVNFFDLFINGMNIRIQ